MDAGLAHTDSQFNLGFACMWLKDRQATWSHTPISLLTALEAKPDCRPVDINIAPAGWVQELWRLRYGVLHEGKVHSKFSFAPAYLRAMESRLNKGIAAAARAGQPFDAILQMGDMGQTPGVANYIYVDLTIEQMLRHMRESGQAMPMYEHYTAADLERRNQRQKDVLAAATGIFAMSHWLKERLIEDNGIAPERIHVLHAGMNVTQDSTTARSDKRASSDKPLILFVGRDFERKGGDLVFEAFEILRRKHFPAAELVVAGPPEWPLDGAVPAGVTFLGNAGHAQLRDYFSRADVFCLPSRYEPFGIVFVEALAAGVPCIGRRDFAMPEIITEGVDGELVDDDNPQKLAELLQKILSDSSMRNNAIQGAQRISSYYHWDRIAADMLKIMQS